ncbi:hypothetical protein G9C98_001102 [Cotesia typhae]|uniref:Alpha-carbonic anhydrase domain-containing protein n=1 Tax=Cotesia typhae TaxID=2053667 RepID=A0A8J5V6I0_9HYME|nr:hypothetical protein G9C98_001102 [Cotesia typhae]
MDFSHQSPRFHRLASPALPPVLLPVPTPFCPIKSLINYRTSPESFVFVAGHLHNTGQFLVFKADKDAKTRVNITGGPLAYHYQFEEIYIHYGMTNDQGSEHQVNNYAFPAEIQVFGFNAELYHNMSEAQHKSQGLVAISLMVQFSRGRCLEIDIDCDKDIKRAGERAWLRIGSIWVLGGEKPTNTRELFGNLRIYSQQNHAVLFLLYPYPFTLRYGNGYGDASPLQL